MLTNNFKNSIIGMAMLAGFGFTSCQQEKQLDPPNILWLTSEDNSPLAGCYGDDFATTPNMDKLASQGFLYTHAYANAPVCAPTRNTIITGVYACSAGNQNMRSFYNKSDIVRFLPQLLREKGYYCTNNYKEDYNVNPDQTKNIWDDSSHDADYKNRKAGQPFFAVYNSMISHESCIHKSIPTDQLRHDPARVKLPPYHPDTPEMRHDWAQYYDKVEDMDKWIGKKLQELDDAGLAENTIVFYYGDHGGVLGRSKRFVYETGTRVPFIVRIPEKYKKFFPADKPGSSIDRMVSFVDLAPTLLSLCNIPVPDWMEGHAFLGKQKTADPEYAFMFRNRMDERYDMSRAVRDQKYRYIRNYTPYRIYGQHLNYLWRAPSMRSWEKAWLDGKCNKIQSVFWNTKPVEELYDTENDPWEIYNLATNPDYKNILSRMRHANDSIVRKIYDTGFIPEADLSRLAGDQTRYDYIRDEQVPLDSIIDAADLATLKDSQNLSQLLKYLKSKNSAIRYWGATGLLMLGDEARTAIPLLESAINDSSPDVAVVASEALFYLGKKQSGLNGMLAVLKNPNPFARTHALNAIDYTNVFNPEIRQAIDEMVEKFKADKSRERYDLRMVEWLQEKYEVKFISD